MAEHPDISMDRFYALTPQDIKLEDFECNPGFILDIGAGGEGIIGLLKGSQVIGIDRNERELRETSNDSLKIVMDATDLKFLDNTFDTVTIFYALMYMPWDIVERVLSEVFRVLRPGGQLLIWDAVVQPPMSTEKEFFLASVNVTFPDGKTVKTGYGSHLRSQSVKDFGHRCSPSFEVQESGEQGSGLFLRCIKPQ
jgi:ubiquinone/menaquinone biosynthesis C-methylase UbiE